MGFIYNRQNRIEQSQTSCTIKKKGVHKKKSVHKKKLIPQVYAKQLAYNA